MALGQLYYLIAMDDSNSASPSFGLVDLFLFWPLLNKIQNFFSSFWFSLLSQVNSKVWEESLISEAGVSHKENEPNGREDNGKVERDEVKMVMAQLGFDCSSETKELEEQYGSKEVSDMFEEQEPSLEEVKQAFDVFDENKDGFIDARELQRVLCTLGLEEAKQLDNCQKMIRTFDENRDGRIDFSEFVKIMENSFC